MKPRGSKPVLSPVSASRRAQSSRVYMRILTWVSEVEPKEVIRPAACHVVPLVNWWRSSKTTSFQPRWAR